MNSKTTEIIKLLAKGKTSKEIIGMGHKPGTVYSAQRKWRQEKERGVTGIENQNLISSNLA